MSNDPAQTIVGYHPTLRDHPLPLTAAGLQALYSDIIVEVAARRHGLVDSEIEFEDLIAYAESRMPAVFDQDSVTRVPAIVAIKAAIDRAAKADEPDGGMTWPPSPRWVCALVDETVTPLLGVFAQFNVHIPGATAYLRDNEMTSMPKVKVATDDDGEYFAHTFFLPLPDEARQVQYTLHRRAGKIHLERRFKGSSDFEPLGEIPVAAASPLLALLRAYHTATTTRRT